jgi:Tripartite tricarboxylate transporter TctB family
MTTLLRGSGQRTLFPGLVWLLALGFLIEAHGFSPAAAAVPLLIGWTTLVLTSLDLFSEIRRRPTDTDVADTETRVPPARAAVAVSGIVLLIAGMTLVGILPSVPVFILIALRWGGRRSLTTSLLTALILTGLLWGTFAGLMRLDLYPGLFFGGDW